MTDFKQAKILILATDGYERAELVGPRDTLSRKGATVHIASPEGGEIRSWDETDWGDTAKSDLALSQARVDDYDALVLPGGQINPDVLRAKPEAVEFIRDFARSGKPVAAICHAPWLLIEAGLVSGKTLTSYPSIRTDLRNAGAEVVDREVAQDGNLITSRNPDDVPAFCDAIAAAVEGRSGTQNAA